ncbi:MAG TPA: hypothetical protein VHZ81_14475 [Galbitalea sp.]|jgi:hypothetical protein|nr:hypothetical protein [Galbitalea sp.]
MRYPNKRALQNTYRASAPIMLVPGGDANPATLGAAFDFATRFVIQPAYIPEMAIHAFRPSRRRVNAILGVIDIARSAADCRGGLAPEPLLRASWALALTTEVFRSGDWRHSPLRQLGWLNFTTRKLLQLAPLNALLQMEQLHSVATKGFFPELPSNPRRMAIGPTFDASRLCTADADLIIDGTLIELKTRLGPASKRDGRRFDSLPSADINQLLSYVLFDKSDKFRIRQVALYSARYGHFVRWDLNEYLSLLSGREMDVHVERQIVWTLLGG